MLPERTPTRIRAVRPVENESLGESMDDQARGWMFDNPRYTGRLLGLRFGFDPYVLATNYSSVLTTAQVVISVDEQQYSKFLKGYDEGKFIARQRLGGKSDAQGLIDQMDADWDRLSKAVMPVSEAEIGQ